MKNTLIGIAIVGAVLGSVAFFGFSPFISMVTAVVGSPVGTTFNTAKIAAVEMTPLTASATSTSILNTDSSARWITSVHAGCTGVGTSNVLSTGAGLAQWLLQVATTSVSGQGLQNNTSLAGNVNIGTTTSFAQSASSTIASTGTKNTDFYYWDTGTYLTFTFNATNTAACIVAANYLPS